MKKKVLIGVKVECDPPHSVTCYCRTVEEQAQNLEWWAREFNAFVRDHRSQDPVDISIVRQFEDQCEHCNLVWDTDIDTGQPLCCKKAIDEWEAAKVTA